MKSIHFATTNQDKAKIAQAVCAENGLVVTPVSLGIDEIQNEDPEVIARDKARRAHEQLGRPVVVSDDTWSIRALKGFPGAYMKSINHWFTPQDFLRLMHGVEDRHIVLHQCLVYADGAVTKVFKNDIPGQIIKEVRGTSDTSPNMTITALDADSGRTMAEVFEQGAEALVARHSSQPDVWHVFCRWYSCKSKRVALTAVAAPR